MSWPLLQFKTFALDNQHWTPITFGLQGLLFKCWLEFTADLKLRSDPNDPTTEKPLTVAKGDQFVMDPGIPVTIACDQVLVYAQSVGVSLNVQLCGFLQRGI